MKKENFKSSQNITVYNFGSHIKKDDKTLAPIETVTPQQGVGKLEGFGVGELVE
ncbi:hypothetical protein [Chryseobacterium sp.]|uniref:hypothetical protein n=1 Tax=Chryseobacterium sp. TaxID=1871047 RepID=UPI002FC70428